MSHNPAIHEQAIGDALRRILVSYLELDAAARKVTEAFTAESEDWNDGTYALWGKDDLISAIVALRSSLIEP